MRNKHRRLKSKNTEILEVKPEDKKILKIMKYGK